MPRFNPLESIYDIEYLNEVEDVTITTPADKEVLAYDTASAKWTNQTPAVPESLIIAYSVAL
jgi:hypothetical protein